MAIIEKIRVVDENNMIRQVCVVDGQPFYLSSGTSTDPKLRDIWLPFKGFGATIPGLTGMFHKPDIASQSKGRTTQYFPDAKIAYAVENDAGKQPLKWGRFKDTNSLLTTCQLSHARMKEEFPNVMSAVEQTYGMVKFWEELTLNDPTPETPPLLLNEDTMHDLNDRLKTMGAILDRDMERDYDPAAEIESAVKDHRDSLAEEEDLSEQAQPPVQNKTKKTSFYKDLYTALRNKLIGTRSVVSNTTASSSSKETSDHKNRPFRK